MWMRNMTLLERIQEINAQDKAWESAGPNRKVWLMTEDLEHWAKSGITTAEQLDAYLQAESDRDMRRMGQLDLMRMGF